MSQSLSQQQVTQRLVSSVLELGALTERQLRDAVTASTERNIRLARTVMERAALMQLREKRIDQQGVDLSAAAGASDPAWRVGCLRLASILRQVRALTQGFCQRVFEPRGGLLLTAIADIESIADGVQAMLHDSLIAFDRGDLGLARQVRACDEYIDRQTAELVHRVLAELRDSPSLRPYATRTMALAKALERIANLTVDISTLVIDLTGKHRRNHTIPARYNKSSHHDCSTAERFVLV